MNKKALLLLLALAAVLGAYGLSQYQSISSDLFASCCDPATDPDCDQDDDDDGGDNGDTMPTQILG